MFFLHFINNIFQTYVHVSVTETPKDKINNDTSFCFCNQFLKWNKMLVKQKVIGIFKKNCKNMSTKQESVSDTAFKAKPFSSDFNFASKNGWVTAATCKRCPLVVGTTVTNCCKGLHLKYSRILRSVFENFAMHEN